MVRFQVWSRVGYFLPVLTTLWRVRTKLQAAIAFCLGKKYAEAV